MQYMCGHNKKRTINIKPSPELGLQYYVDSYLSWYQQECNPAYFPPGSRSLAPLLLFQLVFIKNVFVDLRLSSSSLLPLSPHSSLLPLTVAGLLHDARTLASGPAVPIISIVILLASSSLVVQRHQGCAIWTQGVRGMKWPKQTFQCPITWVTHMCALATGSLDL